ncbi:DUF4301 family protein [Constantimarinum furrinae]|uniref:DUF4301 domain-containing protein n=1 Tax=Constantimarinum furrinae TaxID=2562285 RepID=A0A7G8PSD6_9FLAO|nr:DUF4301 family protein [Constantimarinum furrinae]QNJ97252.1 hypothetical protein ALE3EI_0675 [Constantimarinum furrinae]
MLTEKDVKQIEAHGLTLQLVYKQLETFSLGIPPTEVVTAASVGNGIEHIPQEIQEKLVELYEKKKEELDIVRFIPASGAATRMFKFLHEFLQDYDPEIETLNKYLKRTDNKELATFFSSLKDFAFVKEVRKKIREIYPDFKHYKKGKRCYYFVKTMMEENGLNFANLPKGLIPFHKYTKYYTTAFEEQLYESAFYATAKDDVYLHFTFSEKHVPFFEREFNAIKKRVSKKTRKKFHISYSFQKKDTDTIAVTEEIKPFRNEHDQLIFRPSGHGALLDNLNDVNADIVFLKNIDNVVAAEYVEDIAFYKKLLAGKILWIQKKLFNYIEFLKNDDQNPETIKEIKSFMWNALSIKEIPEDIPKMIKILDRPLRVCGVVKNTGAPGGGPFWVRDEDGTVSLQIVELSQIDTDDKHQNAIVKDATHFNPVDIVCALRNHKGEKFDLELYCDPKTGFISTKSQNGKTVLALERPGLWNGAMAYWNTAFVEIPLQTFNPVKTVNDLLQKEHRPNA